MEDLLRIIESSCHTILTLMRKLILEFSLSILIDMSTFLKVLAWVMIRDCNIRIVNILFLLIKSHLKDQPINSISSCIVCFDLDSLKKMVRRKVLVRFLSLEVISNLSNSKSILCSESITFHKWNLLQSRRLSSSLIGETLL